MTDDQLPRMFSRTVQHAINKAFLWTPGLEQFEGLWAGHWSRRKRRVS